MFVDDSRPPSLGTTNRTCGDSTCAVRTSAARASASNAPPDATSSTASVVAKERICPLSTALRTRSTAASACAAVAFDGSCPAANIAKPRVAAGSAASTTLPLYAGSNNALRTADPHGKPPPRRRRVRSSSTSTESTTCVPGRTPGSRTPAGARARGRLRDRSDPSRRDELRRLRVGQHDDVGPDVLVRGERGAVSCDVRRRVGVLGVAEVQTGYARSAPACCRPSSAAGSRPAPRRRPPLRRSRCAWCTPRAARGRRARPRPPRARPRAGTPVGSAPGSAPVPRGPPSPEPTGRSPITGQPARRSARQSARLRSAHESVASRRYRDGFACL